MTLAALSLTGCQMGYIVNNGYEQFKLLGSSIPIEQILKDPNVDAATKEKLKLAMEAKQFAETRLSLKQTKNYSSYVDLKRPYVTYIVSASPKDELKYYTWHFPIVGSVPYKGYFEKKKADKEAEGLKEEGYDTYVRGVSAYSTVGWFTDPVLSSMMRYSDYDLVNTIIHETVHATLYISNNANFNERMATYLGDLGTKLFYEEKRQNVDAVLKQVKLENEDQLQFSLFLSKNLKELEDWYKAHKKDADMLTTREAQFQKIKDNFKKDLKPKLKTDKYDYFAELKFNNAQLLGYKLYMNDLSDFEKLTLIFKNDFQKIIKYCVSLKKSKDPEKDLKAFVNSSLNSKDSSHP